MSMAENKLTDHDIKFLFNELRKASIIWSGRREVLNAARKKIFVRRAKNGNPIYKYVWKCAGCGQWFKNEKDMEVDHIKEIGGISEFRGDWNEVISRVFPRPVGEHLQALCVPCHARKTAAYNSARSRYKRKPK